MTQESKAKTSTMWGGRFASGPAAVMQEINASIGFDKRLYRQDITGSKAHCAMLVACKIITEHDGKAITDGLDAILAEIEAGTFPFKVELEDIHMNVESRLRDLIGDAAGRLHTGRSRNDQVATDFKLWVRDALETVDAALAELQGALVGQAETHADTVMPGFTHLQTAQPVTFGHHMLAYVEMIGRDRSRVMDAHKRMNECPLGAAALAGTSFPIDRFQTAKSLAFNGPTRNSLDSVSDRDFAIEAMSANALIGIHLSRLAEELVIWTSAQFAFVRLPDSFSTGSSIMPQKRNPDAAELCRAKVGRLIGDLNALMIVMKGLPLAYSKDMQDDKEPTFESFDSLGLCITAMCGMISELTVNKQVCLDAAGKAFSTATDLADWLVRVLAMPFRDAHHVTGTLVKVAEDKGCDLIDLTLADMQKAEPRITDDIFSVLTVESSAASRTSYGGTSPTRVREQCAEARQRFTLKA